MVIYRSICVVDYFVQQLESSAGADGAIIDQLTQLARLPKEHPLSFQFVCKFGKDSLSVSGSSFCHPHNHLVIQLPILVLEEIFDPETLTRYLNSLLILQEDSPIREIPATFLDYLFRDSHIKIIEQFLIKLLEFLQEVTCSDDQPSTIDIFFAQFIQRCLGLQINLFQHVSPRSIFASYLKHVHVCEFPLTASLHMVLQFIVRPFNANGALNERFTDLLSFIFDDVLFDNQRYSSSIEESTISAPIVALLSLAQEDKKTLLSLSIDILDKCMSIFSSKLHLFLSKNSCDFFTVDSLQYLSFIFNVATTVSLDSEQPIEIGCIFSHFYILNIICCLVVDSLSLPDLDILKNTSTLFFVDLTLRFSRSLFSQYQSSFFSCIFRIDIGKINTSICAISSMFKSDNLSLAEAFINSADHNQVEWNELWYLLIILRYYGHDIFSSLICSTIDANMQSERFNKYLLLLALGPREKEAISLTSRFDGRGSDPLPLSLWLFSTRRGSFIFPSSLSRPDAIRLLQDCQEQKTSDDILASIELVAVFQKCICMLKADPVALLTTDGLGWLAGEVQSFYLGIIQNIISRKAFHFIPVFVDFVTCYLLSDPDFSRAACNIFSFSLQLLSKHTNVECVYALSLFFLNLIGPSGQLSFAECDLVTSAYVSSAVWNELWQLCFKGDFHVRGKKESLLLLFKMLSCSINNKRDLLLSSIDSLYPHSPFKLTTMKDDHGIYVGILYVCLIEMLFFASISSEALDQFGPDFACFENILYAFHLLFDSCKSDELSSLTSIYDPGSYDLASFYLVDRSCLEHNVYNERAIRSLYLHSLYALLSAHPQKIRNWWIQNSAQSDTFKYLFDKRNWCILLTTFEKFVSTRFSPRLIRKEIELLKQPSSQKGLSPLELNLLHSSSSSSILVKLPLGEENAVLEMSLMFPQSYPLRPLIVQQTGKRMGVSESVWRRWLLSTQVLLSGGNTPMLPTVTPLISSHSPTILEALMLWKKNAEGRFSGIDECIVCYSIFQPTNFSLPSKDCPTCHHKFHSSCLVIKIPCLIFRANGSKAVVIPHVPCAEHIFKLKNLALHLIENKRLSCPRVII